MEEVTTMATFNVNLANLEKIEEDVVQSLYRSAIVDYDECMAFIEEIPHRIFLFLGRSLQDGKYTLRIINCCVCEKWYGFPYKRFCFCDNCKQYICMDCINSSFLHLYHVKIFDYIIILKEMSYEYNSSIYRLKRL